MGSHSYSRIPKKHSVHQLFKTLIGPKSTTFSFVLFLRLISSFGRSESRRWSHSLMSGHSLIRDGRTHPHSRHGLLLLLSHGVTHWRHTHMRGGRHRRHLGHSGRHSLAHIMSHIHPLWQGHSVGHSNVGNRLLLLLLIGHYGHALIDNVMRHAWWSHGVWHAMGHGRHGCLGSGSPTRLVHGCGRRRGRILAVRSVMRRRRRGRIRRIIRKMRMRRWRRRSVIRIRIRIRLLRGISTNGL